jgi:glyoxylase I family protein
MAERIRIRKLDHVVIRARDTAKMIVFYCDVLGCSLEKHSTAVAGLTHLRAGDSLIDIMPLADDVSVTEAVETNMDHLCIQVEPFTEDGIKAHLEQHGVEVGAFGRRYGADGDGTSVYIRDPEGNEVELKAPPIIRAARSLQIDQG